MRVLEKSRAVVSALVAPLLVALALVPFRTTFPSNDAALVMVLVVVAVAAQGDRIAGLVAAVSATVWFDFFLISPWFTLSMTSAEDRWTILLLLVIGAAVSELAIRGRRQRELAQAAHGRLELLHDASMTLGASLDVERTAQELAGVAVPRFADFVTVDLAEPVLRGEEPTVDGADMRRVAVAGIQENHPFHPKGTVITSTVFAPQARSLLRSGQARIERDLRASVAWRSLVPDHAGPVLSYGIHSLITAPLWARGVPLGIVSFWRAGKSGAFEKRDLPDAEEMAAKSAVATDNARRYTRERTTALALQRSLLPQQLPRQTAVEVAFRYLPADSQVGVGGDWFDVIPLSGSRVALVVGDVVGHGVNASATMGRLRTAVRTLADVDLPPDELLTHLDDVVIRLTGHEELGTAEGDVAASGELGATCLYAIYDPVSRRCALASAGHPLPTLSTPDGTVENVSGFIGPPLGLGGLPFETVELALPVGSVLALHSDGLVKSRDRDFDEGLDSLRDALAVRTPSLDAACDMVINRLVTDRPADDVALLLARTHALSSDRVASWDIPADPSSVERARKVAVEQLDTWGLEYATFATELLVSELVTNAIRYGDSPIQLRLIRDTTLICEVSDASSTAPHLRRARVYDEGGRGLLLVSQLSQNWGTRHATVGKTIWCEQNLSAG
ncbi:SpoIIE family protein phosphatase [Streptomyces sp. ME19-01-6]|uniref:SpoIIE family protein phosphatase n=1 Tax=Streptomyces sp. ME19-01-6 TaxID=3028686 RepID=UPI0029BB07F5|nr:SpoIIE family protein phosphatase [Streptomyces sp. ME19-01-6]MDX3224153.1 SpoIIE family protein phosphatase [Streptomyces sp. ME19-01-6]